MARPRGAYTTGILRAARLSPISPCPRPARRMPRSVSLLSLRAGPHCAMCWEKPASDKGLKAVCEQPCLQEFTTRSCVYYYERYTATQMRTNIEIDDELIREALDVSGLKTKRAAVEAGLRAVIRLNKRKKILDLAARFNGKVT